MSGEGLRSYQDLIDQLGAASAAAAAIASDDSQSEHDTSVDQQNPLGTQI